MMPWLGEGIQARWARGEVPPRKELVGTERFDPDRLIVAMQHSTEVYRDDVAAAVSRLGRVAPEKAELLVATAGEDESAYALRVRATIVDALCRTADEFLGDDEGGYHEMTVHVTRYDRSDAVLEFWFHVGSPGGEGGGVWLRQLVVGIDEHHVYAALGDRSAAPNDSGPAPSPSRGRPTQG